MCRWPLHWPASGNPCRRTRGIRDQGQPRPEYGTVLLAVAGEGSEVGPPFIELTTNATLQGVWSFTTPNQDPTGVPKPYPYAIAIALGNNPAVIDVELLNPYNGIDASRETSAT